MVEMRAASQRTDTFVGAAGVMPAGHPSASLMLLRAVERRAETGYGAVMATVLLFRFLARSAGTSPDARSQRRLLTHVDRENGSAKADFVA